MKNVLVVLILFMTCIATIEAQKKGKKKLSKECKTELRSYYQANVYPIKKAAHDQLMGALSADDLTFVNEQKVKKETIKAAFKAVKKEVRALRKSGAQKEEIKKKREELKKPILEDKKALKEAMKPFIDRNIDIIENAMAPFKETRQKWRTEKKAIIEKYLTDDQKAQVKDKKTAKKKKKNKYKGKINFILWDSSKKEKNEDVEDIEMEEDMQFDD